MSNAGRAVALKAGPLDVIPMPSTMSIDIKKFPFLENAKPGDSLKLSISAVVTMVRLDEDESRLHAELQEVTPQAKEEKQEPVNGIIPK